MLLIKKTIRDLVGRGPAYTMDKVVFKVCEAWYERRLMINTASDIIQLNELGIQNSECNGYSPLEYSVFHRTMRFIASQGIDARAFVDYGSGMGRVVLSAATYPFQRCVGIELSPALNRVAQNNLRKARGKLRVKQIELLNIDATEYSPDDDVFVFCLFNPFKGQVLAKVLENIRTSLTRAPREHFVMYMPPEDERNPLDDYPWLLKFQTFQAHRGRTMYLYRVAL